MKTHDGQLTLETKGVWIPICIWDNKGLTLQEKAILVKIESFKECFASNEYLAEFADVSVSRIKQILRSLEEKGFIYRSTDRKGKVTVKRVISVDKAKFYGINLDDSELEHDSDLGQETVPTKDRKLSQVRAGNCPHNNKANNKANNKDIVCNKSHTIESAFEVFWSAGMVKTNKKRALSLFQSICKKQKLEPFDFANKLADDVKRRLAAGQFGFNSLHPTTYLNNERWNDDVVMTDKPLAQQSSHASTDLNDTSWVDNMDWTL